MLDEILKVVLVGQQDGGQGFLPTILMMAGIFVIFYFLLIRPQQKRQKTLKKQIDTLGKGDKFVTAGGLYAVVVNVKEHIVVAKISEDVKVEIAKSAISGVVEKEAEAT